MVLASMFMWSSLCLLYFRAYHVLFSIISMELLSMGLLLLVEELVMYFTWLVIIQVCSSLVILLVVLSNLRRNSLSYMTSLTFFDKSN